VRIRLEGDDDRFNRLMQVLERIADGIERLIPPLPEGEAEPEEVVIDEEGPVPEEGDATFL